MPTTDIRKVELDRVCNATRGADIKGLIGWLGTQALKAPHFRATGKEIFVGCIDKEVPLAKVIKKDENMVRNLVLRARVFLDNFYEQEGVSGDIWLDFPKQLAGQEPVGQKGAYGIRFETGPRPNKGTRAETEKLRLRPAAAFWDAMICSVRASKSLLIYPADPVEKLVNRKKVIDDRGLESGSGEVAGAFLIGACTVHLHKTIDIRRSCDVTQSELQVPSSCFIYLGSSMKCHLLKDLRARKPWKDLQGFHFEEIKNRKGENVGSVFEGALGKRPRHRYTYKVKRLRDHEVDYALISFFQNKADCQALIAVQGISTIATWAGAMFMCSDARISELRSELNKRYGISASGPLPSFELLLQVDLQGYRPEEIKIRDLQLR